MEQLCVLSRADGGISILKIKPEKSVEEEISKWKETAAAEWLPASVLPCSPDDIPQDRTFRNAWKRQVGRVVVDMTQAREIHRSRLRVMRGPKLAALDVDVVRALESGDQAKLAEIAAKKQALRDVTSDPAIDAAATPDALKAVVPEVLR